MIEPTVLPPGANLPRRDWAFDGFNLGANTFALATELKGNELAEMLNVELYGKRAIRPRRGGTPLGNGVGGTRIDGLFQYKEGTTNDLLALSGGALKKYNSSTDVFDTITGGSFTADLRTRSTKMRSNLYLGNGTDDFARYNGTIVSTFTAVAAPSALAVVPQGTTGTTAYEYTVTTVTEKGDSLPCTNVAITTGNEVLDTTNYNRITFNRKTESQVIGYNIYGRRTTGNGVTLMKYIDQPSSGNLTWDDKGTVTPQVWLPPDGDSTDGQKLSMWEQLRGSLVGAGDPTQQHTFFWTGTGDKYESFSPAHNGGWVQVRQGDNDAGVNGMAPFESKIIIFKEQSIHQFYFSPTTGDALLQELITYTGCGAPGSVVVMENDIAFMDSERKLRILGYEPNFTTSIRTTSLSEGRVQSIFDTIDTVHMKNSEAVYFKGQYLLAVTTQGATQNDMIIPYDRRYLAFLGKWTGTNAHVRCWLPWDGYDGQRRLFAGSSLDDTVFQFDVEGELTDYDASGVQARVKTRSEDLGNSGQSKLYKWVDLRLYRIQGLLRLGTILNGQTALDTRSFSSKARSGWGVIRWGKQKWGTSTGVAASASTIDKTYRKEIYEIANALQFELFKTGAQDDFVLISLRGEAFMLPTEVFDSANMIT